MTTIRTHAALLLAMLPALVTRSLTTGDDDPDAAKADPVRAGEPMGRAGVLELLESGMISTEEALDLLDGIDQTSPATDATERPPDSDKRPGRPARPARPARAARTAMGTLDADLGSGDPGDGWDSHEDRQARREERQVRREERHAERAAAREARTDRIDTGFGGKRTFRIQVDDANGSKVNLALPIGFLDTGLKVAERFSPGLLDGAVGNSIRRAVGGGQAGTIIEVDDGAGQHVRIAIE